MYSKIHGAVSETDQLHRCQYYLNKRCKKPFQKGVQEAMAAHEAVSVQSDFWKLQNKKKLDIEVGNS